MFYQVKLNINDGISIDTAIMCNVQVHSMLTVAYPNWDETLARQKLKLCHYQNHVILEALNGCEQLKSWAE